MIVDFATDGDMTVLKVMPKLLNVEQRFARGKGEDATAMAANQPVYKRDARQRSMRHDNKESHACANLVSIGKAAEAGVNVTFHHGGCKLQSGTTVINVLKKNGVYMLTYSKEQRALKAMHQETAELWHHKYGHLSYSSLAQLVKKDMVTGINLSKEETARLDTDEFRRKVCSGCIAGKQQRNVAKSHPGSEPAITEKLGLLHMDVCGPIEPTSMGGSRYIATFLDDYTKFSVVRLIKVKNQVPEEIKSVIAELERQTGLQVKAIRSDRGGEYINQTLQDYLKKKGIVQQLTAPYSPEQNGKAERLNRTLVERVRSMLHSSQVSKNLWAEAVVTANCRRNCSPTTGHTKTPWELFYNVKPDVSNMRIFGSIAYVHTPKELRKKLDPKGKPGIFLGYEPHAKAYRVLVDGKVKISKDVVVDENEEEEEEEQISNVHVPAEDHMEQDIPPDVLPTATSQILHHRCNSDGSGGDEDGRRVRSRMDIK
ncbi:hypothetical protein CEUSTIGMA_g7991.t1 [Chlamydomonas eustigma]|uniref:Integrase catalytic domain-containing protein n=1 Tax=Chlamydomonas eustigma TaxID=1157962 RepID=A0A250XBU5_9CHLO|nr:hypothetical protein CEUSTIGMA_g7991.t1 [Chlamydomonas eustigma]|eukprot:GAX80554.1 hypothetical protein CEUSTIGMA_g7991.t1 [Chlamydomonas eustigma]